MHGLDSYNFPRFIYLSSYTYNFYEAENHKVNGNDPRSYNIFHSTRFDYKKKYIKYRYIR